MPSRYSQGSLEAQASTLAAILEAAVDAIVTINGEGIIGSVNPAAEQLFHYTRDEMVGQNINFLMPETLPVTA